MFWNTICHCCWCFMQRSHPVTHPAEYLEWATHGWTQWNTHTLTSRCWKCAGFHMYTHECRQIVTHKRRQTWVTPPKLTLRGHPHPTTTLLFSPLPLFLGRGAPWRHLPYGVKAGGESPVTPLIEVGIPVSWRPTPLPPPLHKGVGVMKKQREAAAAAGPLWKTNKTQRIVEHLGLPSCQSLSDVSFSSSLVLLSWVSALLSPLRFCFFFLSACSFWPYLHALIPFI